MPILAQNPEEPLKHPDDTHLPTLEAKITNSNANRAPNDTLAKVRHKYDAKILPYIHNPFHVTKETSQIISPKSRSNK